MKRKSLFRQLFETLHFQTLITLGIAFLFLWTLFYFNTTQIDISDNFGINPLTSFLKNYYFSWKSFLLLLSFIFFLYSAVFLQSYILSQKWLKPFRILKRRSQKSPKDIIPIKIRSHLTVPIEFFEIGEIITQISTEFQKNMTTLLQQKNEQDALFLSLSEGVIAIDNNLKIIHFNQSAKDILEIKNNSVEGFFLTDLTRNSTFQKFIQNSISSSIPLEQEIEFLNHESKVIKFKTNPLLDAQNERLGIVIVFNDITQIKKFENHRKEFVSNVSHEIKTPLTSIRGFSETLLRLPHLNVPEAKEFLSIINHQVIRLCEILDELLVLSRFEETNHVIETSSQELRPLILRAIDHCKISITKDPIEFNIQCPEKMSAEINGPLLEQALVNLIDNAIKYGGHKIQIHVTLKNSNEIEISVIDDGPGISSEHLPRLFERFYRIDKVRTGGLGGTGLGLSIVKHITIAHHGEMRVESKLGEGSRFIITIPKNHGPANSLAKGAEF